MNLWINALVTVLGALACSASSTADCAHVVPVTVTVTAQHGDGTPLSDLWIALVPDDLDTPDVVSRTDAEGTATFSFEPPPDGRYLFLTVAGLGDALLAPIDERQSVRVQAREILPNYSFEKFLMLPLEDGVTEYQAVLTLHPSVRVSVQLVNESGEPASGGVMIQMNGVGRDADSNRVGESDPLSIGGIRRGAAAHIAIYGPTSPKPFVIHLDETQTLADVDLGPLYIPPYQPGTVPLHLALTNTDQLQTRAVEAVEGGVVIFSTDGQSSITFALDPSTGKMAHWPSINEPETPRLDPGTYYVAPGNLGTSRADLLRRLLLNGADVDAAGVPKIEAVAGQEVHLTIDAAAAERAILAAAGQ